MSPSHPPLSPANDADLLHRYQSKPDEASFRRLVEQHLPLVWSTARRLVNGDEALAEDVTQIVFTDFAQKAPALPLGSIAAGWLHRHTCFTARKLVRTEIRRRTREHTAAQLQLDDAMTTEPNPLWLDAAPHVDAALDQLPRPDREALLLRFWQQHDHRSIGTSLGSTEEAARKRIARALEKLRTLLRRRGVLLTAALLSQFLADHATAAVPPTFAATLPGAAWRQATANGPVSAASVSLLRRFWPAAAVILVSGGLWSVAEAAGWFRTKSDTAKPTAQTFHQASPVSSSTAPISLHFTLANLPSTSLTPQLLNFQPGRDDEGLFASVLTFSRTGGTLLEYELAGPVGRTLHHEQNRIHHYSDAWTWNEKTNLPVARNNEEKKLGITMEATVRLLPDDIFQLAWAMRHHYSDPEWHAWPLSLEASGGDPGRSVNVEDFHEAHAEGLVTDLIPGSPRLLMVQYLSAMVLPDAQPGPRTLLLFVTSTLP